MNENQTQQIQLFRSVFRGREDVFAVHWENGKKSGYMPAYSYDPYLYRTHKIRGGTFQNYRDKTYLPLSDKVIEKHLKGEQLVGIYPLLPDNTSWFIAADFDDDNWLEECKTFLNICYENKIPAYLERSRSGHGGHICIFFDQPYPAIRSRKIMLSLLEKSGVFSVFDKSSSFDRLFPNQDYLSGKGLGNLIALTLYKKTFEQGNSCFLDAVTLQPFLDQFVFLKNINRVAIAKLDELFQLISASTIIATNNQLTANTTSPATICNQLTITLNNVVRINRNGLSNSLINFLKEELNFANTEYFIKTKAGRSTFETQRYYKFVEEIDNEVIVPRGFIGKLIRFCQGNSIKFNFNDKRKKLNPVEYQFNAQLREHQQSAIDTIAKKDFGIIVAPPGSGKTIVGLKIISDRNQPALIIVHRKQLVEQWIERIETFLGIPKHEIGRIGQGKSKVGKKITIATIQSLSKEFRPEFEVLKPYFAKTLNTKFVSFDIYAEFENGKLVSQLATSTDLQKINQEVIEGVRFQFITNSFLSMKPQTENNLMTVNDLLKKGNNEPNLYNDGQTLLDDLLSHKNFRHSKQLRYLADRHERTILKIRFVLSPFTFVFLLSCENQFHIVLETLDTEEATYLWHIEKDKTQLKSQLKTLDEQLSIIRNKGRQTFLNTKPENFTKILHDYSDTQKGFVIWKDLLEERIN